MYVDPWGLETTLLDVLRYTRSNADQVEEWYNDLGASGSWEEIKKASAPTRPDNIIELDDTVILYVYVSVEGDLANTPMSNSNGTTYGQAALMGVVEAWSGRYDGTEIVPWIIEVNDGDEPYVHLQINNENGIPRMLERTKEDDPWVVNLYNRRPGLGHYDYPQFRKLAGHEFGHVFGIDDLYSDKAFDKKYTLTHGTRSIMERNPPGTAQPVDYALMIRAQQTGEFQYWNTNADELIKLGFVKER